MNSNSPKSMDKFIDQYGSALRKHDSDLARTPMAQMATPEGMQQLTTRFQALQMHTWAANIALNKQHSFVKKVMEEVR